jgi:hypothetical protein
MKNAQNEVSKGGYRLNGPVPTQIQQCGSIGGMSPAPEPQPRQNPSALLKADMEAVRSLNDALEQLRFRLFADEPGKPEPDGFPSSVEGIVNEIHDGLFRAYAQVNAIQDRL